MQPLYRDPWYTFRFAESRLVPRVHLEGVAPGRLVSLVRIHPTSGVRLHELAAAIAGEDGWVDLPEPILMHAGEAFIAIPQPETP